MQAFANLPDPRSRTCAYPIDEPCLTGAIEPLFANPDAGLRESRLHHGVALDKGHSRLETQRCVVRHELDASHKQLKAWPTLKTAVMIESTRATVNARAKGECITPSGATTSAALSSMQPSSITACAPTVPLRIISIGCSMWLSIRTPVAFESPRD